MARRERVSRRDFSRHPVVLSTVEAAISVQSGSLTRRGVLGRRRMMIPETTRPPARVPAPAEVPSRGLWSLADIDYAAIDRHLVAGDTTLFQIVALASFIETGSDLYAHNLVASFDDDAEAARWLAESWEHGAVQHGAALRSSGERAGPDVDWHRAL